MVGPHPTCISDHQVDTGVNRADLQQPIVLAVLDTGVDRNIVKIVIERRLRETGKEYEVWEKLVHRRLLKSARCMCVCLYHSKTCINCCALSKIIAFKLEINSIYIFKSILSP